MAEIGLTSSLTTEEYPYMLPDSSKIKLPIMCKVCSERKWPEPGESFTYTTEEHRALSNLHRNIETVTKWLFKGATVKKEIGEAPDLSIYQVKSTKKAKATEGSEYGSPERDRSEYSYRSGEEEDEERGRS